MKKIILILLAAGITGAGFISAQTEDPVIMTVGDKPVYKSEFEYLYHKNAGQQLEPSTKAEYAEMFKKYKLKVADAEAAGLDTTKALIDELASYRAELAQPYLRDPKVDQALLEEAYDHYKRQLRVSHLMILESPVVEQPDPIKFLDSLRNEINAGNVTWDDAVARYTIHGVTKNTGGDMGWMPVDGTYPWEFEEMAYNTPIGEISKPVNSGAGFHLIKVTDQRPNEGEVQSRHILKLTRGKSDADAEKAKVLIDSIYNVLLNNPEADFATIAKEESEDPGSAQRGGELGWFGRGRLVPEFEEVMFSLKNGEISKPFKTAFGWHIVQREDSRPMLSFEDAKPTLKAAIEGSSRSLMSERSKLDQLIEKYNSHILDNNLDNIKEKIEQMGGYNKETAAELAKLDIPVYEVDGKTFPLSEVMPHVAITASKDAANARALIASAANRAMELSTLELERIRMADDNVDYRNLVNEYRDGILLFEISQQKVWQRAASDRQGLENYFKKNKKNYTFDEPRFKAFVVFCPSDSLENEVKAYLGSLKTFDPTTLAQDVRDKFGKSVRVERVIAKKGENAITDYLGFEGPRPDSSKVNFTNFFAFRGKIINNPEDVDDIRGQVISDYQNELEREWVKQLEKKYPVKINKAVLDSVK